MPAFDADWVAGALFGERSPHLRRALEACGYPIPPVTEIRVAIDFATQPDRCVVSFVQAGRWAHRELAKRWGR